MNINVCSSCLLRSNICVLCGLQPEGCAGLSEMNRVLIRNGRLGGAMCSVSLCLQSHPLSFPWESKGGE